MINYASNDGYILKFKLNLDNDVLLKKCLSVLSDSTLSKITKQQGEEYHIQTYERISSYPFRKTSEANPHTWDEFKPAIDFLSTFSDYSSIAASWVAKTLEHGYIGPHAHASIDRAEHSAFIYYVSLNDTHPCTRFFINDEWITIDQKQGDFIYFDGRLVHDHLPNEGIGDRIVIAGNIL